MTDSRSSMIVVLALSLGATGSATASGDARPAESKSAQPGQSGALSGTQQKQKIHLIVPAVQAAPPPPSKPPPPPPARRPDCMACD